MSKTCLTTVFCWWVSINFPQDILFDSDLWQFWFLYNNEILHWISYNWEKRRQREIWTLISKTTAFSLIYLRTSLCHSSNAFFALGLKSIIAFLWGEQSRMTEDKYGLCKRERKRQIQRERESLWERLLHRVQTRSHLNHVSLSFCTHFVSSLVFYFDRVMLGTSTHIEISFDENFETAAYSTSYVLSGSGFLFLKAGTHYICMPICSLVE